MSISAAFMAFGEHAPGFQQPWMTTVQQLAEASALDPKTEELAYLAVLAASGIESGLPFHVMSAVKAGATRDEVISALLVAIVGLPLLLRGVTRGVQTPHAAEERSARIVAAQAAIRAIDALHEKATEDLDESSAAYAADVTARVMDIYRRRLATLDDDRMRSGRARRAEALEMEMRLAAMRAERAALLALRNGQKINDETMSKLVREVDLSETALTSRGRPRR